MHSTLSGKLRGNEVNVDLQVPSKAKGGLLAKVKMPNHGLSAEPRGAPDERRAIVCIFERDPGRGAHDALTQLRPRVEGGAVEMKYQCQHPRDTAELLPEWKVPDGYTQPEFFYTVEVDGVTPNSTEASSRGLIDT